MPHQDELPCNPAPAPVCDPPPLSSTPAIEPQHSQFQICTVCEFWGRLLTRNGTEYTFEEMRQVAPGSCEMEVVPDGRTGKCYHANCSSHNSQGPIYPEIVRIYLSEHLQEPPGLYCAVAPGSPATPYDDVYIFEYSVGPHELDAERKPMTPGETWIRNDEDTYKGFVVDLIVACSEE